MGRIKSFSAFNKIAKEVFQNNAVNYQQDFTTELGGEIAKLTPVDTGRATANWTGSINSPDVTPKKKYDNTFSANPTKQAIRKAIGGSRFGNTLYVSNGVQGESDSGGFTGEGYIQKLEDGKSKKSPKGMVLINIARAEYLSKKALNK